MIIYLRLTCLSIISRKMKKKPPKIHQAGGGSGRENLNFSILKEGQDYMLLRTLAPGKVEALTVNVAREDSLDVEGFFDVNFKRNAAQAAWPKFLSEISVRLKVEFIEVLLDRKDNSQVHSINTLRPGGFYLVRQRESSAILNTIFTGTTPSQVAIACS